MIVLEWVVTLTGYPKEPNWHIAKEVIRFLNDNFKDDLALEVVRERPWGTNYVWWLVFRNAHFYKEPERLCSFLAVDLINDDDNAKINFKKNFTTKEEMDKMNYIGLRDDGASYWIVPFKENYNKLQSGISAYLNSVRKMFDNGTLPRFRRLKVE